MARTRSSASRQTKKEPATPRPTWDERLIRQLLPWRREIAGLLLFLLAAVFLLGLLGLTQSGLIGPPTSLLRQLAGWGAFPLTISAAAAGLTIALQRAPLTVSLRPSQLIGLELMLLAALPISHLFLGNGLAGALDGRGGGLIGWALSDPLIDFFGAFLTVLLHLGIFTWGLALAVKVGWSDLIRFLNDLSEQLRVWSAELDEDVAQRQIRLGSTGNTQVEPPSSEGLISARPAQADGDEDALIIIDDSAEALAARPRRRSRHLPPLDVLEEGTVLALTTEEIDEKKQIIEQTLLDFGLPALVTEIRRGPAVTQFGVQPGYIERTGPEGSLKQYKIRVGQIAALNRDLALALAVPRLRIEAPVPGRGIVGVEVPNSSKDVVRLRTVIESETFQRIKSPLAVALGRDVAGAPIAADLGKLPHLLIAGTTGSGKSVCLIAMITCLVFNNRPEQLKLIMIDPKKVELIRFNGLPHLLGKVEVEGERIIGVLRWLTAEMDRRYELFAATGAKHLADYNRKATRQEHSKLPHIAVFLDELADLMATYPAEVERTLCRLAQMARATGIHLVVATQRPSTDVITGLIKANFPARASFAVASGTDSRVILDTVGAEHLLGRGDMLYLPPDASAPVRVQGCFVSDREIEAVVTHWQSAAAEAESEAGEPPWETLIVRRAFIDEKDEMLERAIELAQRHDTLSTSFIQRRLRVGYPRAARLMETLYEMGLVEDPKEGGKTRRTTVSEEDDPLNDYLAQQE